MKSWTIEEEELIKMFVAYGLNSVEISFELDTTEYQVYKKRKLMGLVSPKVRTKKYVDLYKGTEDEVRNRLIVLMQEAPRVSADYFNSKDSDVPVAATYKKYFGSWGNALIAAGISPPICAMKADRPTVVYLVDFGDFYKIGITQQGIHQRLGSRYPKYEVLIQITTSLSEARSIEATWLSNVSHLKFIPTNFPIEGRGYTECFKL